MESAPSRSQKTPPRKTPVGSVVTNSNRVGGDKNSNEQRIAGPNDSRRTGASPTRRTTPRQELPALIVQLLSGEIVQYFDKQGDFTKLENLGFQVGSRITERFTRNYPKFLTTLEVVKFLCKDFWNSIFGKQVDKLQTNHRGVYVLHDDSFCWVSKMSVDYNSEESLDQVKKYLIFPCGLIRGALCNLGLRCTVKAEFSTLPMCKFNVEMHEELLPST